MTFLPVCLNLKGRRILMVGGGKVALQKLKVLSQFTSDITVCAPRMLESIKSMPVALQERPYAPILLEGVAIVFACTNDSAVNRQIWQDAQQRHILVNVADEPASGDFISAAVFKQGALSIAVSTGGENVKEAIALRDRIKELLKRRGDVHPESGRAK